MNIENGPDWRAIAEGHAMEAARLQTELDVANTRIEDLTTAENRCINDALAMGQQVAQRAGSGVKELKGRIMHAIASHTKPKPGYCTGVLADLLLKIAAQPAQPDSGRDAALLDSIDAWIKRSAKRGFKWDALHFGTSTPARQQLSMMAELNAAMAAQQGEQGGAQ